MHTKLTNNFSKNLFIPLLLGIISSCTTGESEEPFLLGSGFGINSTTLLVDDLESTADYFRDTLGFDVPSDLEKTAFPGTHLTFISFPDMSALEILSLNDSAAEEARPFITSFLKKGEGVRMYALSSSSLDSTKNSLSSREFNFDSIRTFRTSVESPEGWSWDNGESDIKRVDFSNLDQTGHLPGFVEYLDFDYPQAQKQWKTYYSYNRRYNEHPNGVVGIRALKIAVGDLDVAREEFLKMGLKEIENEDTKNEVRFKLFRNQEIQLIAPKSPEDRLWDFLKANRQGVFAIRFEVKKLNETHEYLKELLPEKAMMLVDSPSRLVLSQDYAQGVQLEFIEEPEEQALMAMQLRPDDELDSTAIVHAAELYTKYCALCHGDDREGYAADNAPSLRSHSLLATAKGTNFLRYTIHYGRAGTAMAGYLDREGGPLEYIEVELILKWLYETSGVEEPVELSREPVLGDVALGSSIYSKNCAVCHGANGEGISAPALGNPMLLATATDHFLRYAIAEGRNSTPMISFKDSLSNEEIDAVTAFLRSRASGWDIPKGDTVTIPPPEKYVLNPNCKSPTFELKAGKYLPAVQLMKAMQDSQRLIILDARSEVAWRQTHIPGSIPVPYYEEPENFVEDLPNDSTWIVAYCACPHAASDRVVTTLRRHGFQNTAILDEGVLVWAQLGYPVLHGN